MRFAINKVTLTRMACVFVFCIAVAPALPAQTFNRLHAFDLTDGEYPQGLVQGADGNLYGNTEDRGAFGYGSIFKITPLGKLTTIHSFCSGDCHDGAYPNTLVESTPGEFLGTTWGGGVTGQGTVFKISASGVLTTLYSFCPNGLYNCTDGDEPDAGLVEAADGNFYGITEAGGNGFGGTVFKITPGGELTTLHSFNSIASTDGWLPTAALIQASDGNLYGTTVFGGAQGSGTIFRVTPKGSVTTFHNFCSLSGCADGFYPYGGLIQGTDGNLYGTTTGLPNSDEGTVFMISLDGMLTTLYNFCTSTNCVDGGNPSLPLVQGTDGNFYGTTAGPYFGSIFEMTPEGQLTRVYNFTCSDRSGCLNGDGPSALILHTNGKFYGTARIGGIPNSCSPTGCGTVFSLDANLAPFVETLPISGKVGSRVTIIGQNLKGTTSVSFSGVPAATFKVVTDTYLTAVVPAGATTGEVVVTTPTGTFNSNGSFRVIQ